MPSKETNMVRYYKTPDGQTLQVDREMVDATAVEAAVQVSFLFGELLYTTKGRVQEDDLEGVRLDNAADAAHNGDHEVMLSYLAEEAEKYDPLFDEAEAWIMEKYPGSKRSHEDEAALN